MASDKIKAKRSFVKGTCINREYSWLLFNKRVLDQASDKDVPILERAKFLGIFASNLDEFFMVRVGSLYNLAASNPEEKENKTGLTAQKQLDGICQVVGELYEERADCYSALVKDLAACGVKLIRAAQLSPRQLKECQTTFKLNILPQLSLMVLDAKHPMMQFENKRNYMLYDLSKGDRSMIGVMALNENLNKLYRVGTGDSIRLITLEELIRACGAAAFTGYDVKDSMLVRCTRNADFDTYIDDADLESDFSQIMKKKVASRARMNIVRVEVDSETSKLKDFVLKLIKVDPKFCFVDKRYFDYKFLFQLGKYLPDDIAAPLKYNSFKGRVDEELSSAPSMIETVLSRDVFLSYPYDAMTPLETLLDECSRDDRVSAISITIYRLAHHSRIADLLCRASENGKMVTVVIELCARFDEENNMYFARKLQEAGCTIIYGMENYKVHSKIISIVLNDGDDIRYITHLGTGNYNESTSKQYTDLNIITADRRIGEDGAAFFRNISICNTDYSYDKLLVAPKTLKSGLMAYMDREIAKGEDGYILAKMNSLTDKAIIDKLQEASCAGVKVELIIRGICCILPGVEGKTENISVISIVGRFLEHSRVYSFGKGKDRVTYISSADLMTRNVDKRVEIAAPVLDKGIEERILKILRIMLSDNVKARKLCPDGKYRKVTGGEQPIDAQDYLLNHKI
ncbi:MAG TPA: polyphosphate kinase 1 [Candidatus Coproplasma avicola]|uniref:Polyphosphate kinase n=1 Tax=Candidatus Coproplasma avicola TaxID=2840744 RepID=A0A9D1J8B7_9FIRM|nr:polyphosphate kinase 1 [Candidatus Coproplasma avicola]